MLEHFSRRQRARSVLFGSLDRPAAAPCVVPEHALLCTMQGRPRENCTHPLSQMSRRKAAHFFSCNGYSVLGATQ